MKEVDLQSDVLHAVRKHGGFGFKLANKFLKGVPDLFIHVDKTTSIWEVKLLKCQGLPFAVHPPLTPLQFKFLDDYRKAGGVCGVISFVHVKKTKITCVAAMRYPYAGCAILHKEYVALEKGKRDEAIWLAIKNVL